MQPGCVSSLFFTGVNFTGLKFPSEGEIFSPNFCTDLFAAMSRLSQAWDTPNNFATGDTDPQVGFCCVPAAAVSAWSQAQAVL